MSWISEHLAPLMFGGMVLFMLVGYPAAFSLAATGLFFGFIGIEFGLIRPDFLGNLTYQLFGIISNDLLLAIPFFTFMGAILERCGLAEDLLEFDRAIVRPGARRPVLCGDFRRRHSRRDHRHGRRFRHRHGRHLNDADAQIRLFDAPHHGRDRSVRHYHPAHPAVARSGGAGRPTRPLGRRHVCRRDRAEPHPGRAVLRLGRDPRHSPPAGPPGLAARGAHAAWLATPEKVPARHHPVARRSSSSCSARSSWASPPRPKPAPWAWSAPLRWLRSTAR